MNNSLIPYEELGLTEARKEIIEKFIYYKEQVESFESEIKDKFKEMVEAGDIPVNSIDLGDMMLSYKKSYTRKSVDTDKLKELLDQRDSINTDIVDLETKKNIVKH